MKANMHSPVLRSLALALFVAFAASAYADYQKVGVAFAVDGLELGTGPAATLDVDIELSGKWLEVHGGVISTEGAISYVSGTGSITQQGTATMALAFARKNHLVVEVDLATLSGTVKLRNADGNVLQEGTLTLQTLR